ncbi:MAG: TonB-dependent receptor [Muribaculaceae bacterium]|nr:TonB-dependent receptor [Muribaculaceae bacterium]
MAEDADSVDYTLDEFQVVQRSSGTRHLRGLASNTQLITAKELTRAACCNLGESFTTNPSVDVSYNDAATGARQIKLLGLSGAYVQMMTENLPNFRGSALPYGLSFIPGPWIQSISVSKGASSVKNGYESITGQINIELKKPQADRETAVNAYVDSNIKAEVNANVNTRLSPEWSTGLLVHGENSFKQHDTDGDGFMDMPEVRQVALMNRWARLGSRYVFQGGIKYLFEERKGGQTMHGHHVVPDAENGLYTTGVRTNRAEVFTKNAYIFDKENEGNVALMANGSYNALRSHYGNKLYDVNQTNVYAQLMFERKYGDYHALSTGLSFNYDNFHQSMRLVHDSGVSPVSAPEHEAVTGTYAQYTLNLDTKLLVMGGLRYDYSSLWGGMITPRVHVRWTPLSLLSAHASAGRGYRTPHVMAENTYLLASGRNIIISPDVQQEEALNTGAGFGLKGEVFGRSLNFEAEYYYTRFSHQLLVDIDSDPTAVYFKDLKGKSYSQTVQIQLDYDILDDLNFLAAYRFTDVKVDYGQGLVQKPLTSRNKALFTLSYSPMMGIWQMDVTCSINGTGRMPTAGINSDGTPTWPSRYPTYAQLNAQVTRNFKHWAVYVGGENLTGYRQKSPIIGAENPWGTGFDATMIYAPLHGAMVYAGFRYTLTRY